VERFMGTSSASEGASGHRPAHFIIFGTVLLDLMASAIASPVLPRLMAEVGDASDAEVARLFGLYATVFFGAQLFAAPLQGALSDRFGRRPVILASSFGMALSFAMLALAPNLAWLFVGRFMAGLASGAVSVSYAYLIDVTEPERRARLFSFLGFAASLGGTLGLTLGGVAGEAYVRAPFWIGLALSLANALVALFLLPESLAPERRRAQFGMGDLNPLAVVMQIARTYPRLRLWGGAVVLGALANIGTSSVFAVYTTHRYDWAPRDLAAYLIGLNIWSMGLQLVAIPWLTVRFTPWRALVIGGVAQGVFLAGCGLAINTAGYWASAFTYLLGGQLFAVTLTSLVSQSVSGEDQGRTQGAFSALQSAAGLVGPGLMALLLGASIDAGGKGGLPFFVGGALILAQVALLAALRPGASRSSA
jgi:DHA1 family tetracycline resistance protein-like MFS transporter